MESISRAIATASDHLTEHPEAGSGTDTAATAVREQGLRFRVEGPKGEVITDMSKTVGGGATAPTPGWLLRAALASCDATAVAMEAAREGVELTDLTVTVESESDFRGVLGVDDSVHPGPAQCGCASSWREPTPLRISCARSFSERSRVRRFTMRSCAKYR